MKYIENNYYELIEHGKSYVIRFVGEIHYKYKFINISQNSKEVYGYNNGEFGPLKISITSAKSELKKDSNRNLIIFDLNTFFSNLNKTLELSFDEKSREYFLTYTDSSGSKNEVVENDINDFFDKIEILLDMEFSQDQKDQFLIEQFS